MTKEKRKVLTTDERIKLLARCISELCSCLYTNPLSGDNALEFMDMANTAERGYKIKEVK